MYGKLINLSSTLALRLCELAMKKVAIAALSLLVTVTLAGCFKSDVDKCVEAQIRADEPYKSAQARADGEADARIRCMRAAAGNR